MTTGSVTWRQFFRKPVNWLPAVLGLAATVAIRAFG